MQFNFFISKAVHVNENGISIINAKMKSNPQLDEIINCMGEASAKAQQLKQVITSNIRFFQTDQRIYMKSASKLCLGFIKVGKKNLFYRDFNGNIKELQPICVLDFYVHESVQRGGIGKILFEEMLKAEGIQANKLAYDRPSPKLLGFLKKHYNLCKYIPQNNNYVIYSQYFETDNSPTKQEFDQLDKMMQEMTISKQQQQKPQNQQYQFISPWATDQKLNNIYQTTTGMMSAQIHKR
ncbi:hypothetical protein pb186bvf_008185 [Paramecium bursaria]